MEARKRGTGTPRESSTDEYDVEANNSGGDQLNTPYSGMMMEPAKTATATANNNTTDGLMTSNSNNSSSPPAGAEDSHIRSLAKGLTWRFIASGTTIVIAKIVTGETTVAFQIGFFEFFAKIGIYYVHERIWAKIKL